MNYKAPDNSLHFIEPEYAHLLPAGSVPITEAQASIIKSAREYVPVKDKLLINLLELESKVTPRMLREASMGGIPSELILLAQDIATARANMLAASTAIPDLTVATIEVTPALFGADPETPIVPAVTRLETTEEYTQRLEIWLQENS